MKKLFTLVAVVGTFALVSCGGEHKEEAAAADSTAVAAEATADTAAVATADSATAAAPAEHH